MQLRAQIGPAVITIGGRLGRALLIFLRMPRHLLSLLSFKSQQIMLASTGTKLIAVFIAGIPMCLVGGLVYSWTSGKTVMDGMINAYGALYKIPGPALAARFCRICPSSPACRPLALGHPASWHKFTQQKASVDTNYSPGRSAAKKSGALVQACLSLERSTPAQRM